MANWFERALLRISPETAARRIAYRRKFELLDSVRAYDGASRGRRLSGWTASASSADAELSIGGPILRQRARDLVRNNSYAKKIVQSHADNIVGAGIVPRANTGTPRDDLINKLFDNWVKQCAPDGMMDFYGMQHLACRQMVEGGEVLARKRFRRQNVDTQGKKPEEQIAPLNVQLLEAEFIDSQKNGVVGRNLATNGIEYDSAGGRRGYWLFQQHPGAAVVDPKLKRESVFIRATEVAHLFEPERQQVRGVTWLATIMVDLRDLGDYEQAELVRKKIEACVTAFVTPGDDDTATIGQIEGDTDTTGVTDSAGYPVERFEPGMIAYLHGGKDIKFNNPSISAGVEAFMRTKLRKIAVGARMPYELLTGDLSQANYSSNRMGIMQYRRFVEHMQWHVMIPMFCQPIWQWFLEALQLIGIVKEDEVIPVEWSPPKHEMISPVEDVKADILAARAGIRSMPDIIGSTGRTPKQVLKEIADWNTEIDKVSVTLDTDPRKVAINGQLQFEQSDTGDGTGADTNPPATKQGTKSNGKKAKP